MTSDILIEGLFYLVWLGVFYGVAYFSYRYIPKGLFIIQILFVYVWILLPKFQIAYMGILGVNEIPVFWVVATLMVLIKAYGERDHSN